MLVTLDQVKGESWSRTDQLLALIADAVNVVGYYTALAVVKDPKKVKPPKPIERPGVAKPRGTTLGQLKQMMKGGSDG